MTVNCSECGQPLSLTASPGPNTRCWLCHPATPARAEERQTAREGRIKRQTAEALRVVKKGAK